MLEGTIAIWCVGLIYDWNVILTPAADEKGVMGGPRGDLSILNKNRQSPHDIGIKDKPSSRNWPPAEYMDPRLLMDQPMGSKFLAT